MKTLKFIILLIASVVIGGPLMAQTGKSLTIPLTSPGKPFTLNVNFLTGSIDVAAYDGSEIVIDFSSDEKLYNKI